MNETMNTDNSPPPTLGMPTLTHPQDTSLDTNYVEHDTNPSGDGFTWTDNLYVTSNSYSLTAADQQLGGNSSTTQYVAFIAAIVLTDRCIIVIIIIALSRRSRKTFPNIAHNKQYTPPASSPPPAASNRFDSKATASPADRH